MAQFYGSIKGSRGGASRLGTKASGLDITAASWQGAVRVSLWHDEAAGVDMAEVALDLWDGEGSQRTLYRGPVSGKDS